MKDKIKEILVDVYQMDGRCEDEATERIFRLFGVMNIDLIEYIENEAEVLIPIEEMFNKDGTHITKKEYGQVVIKYLAKELRKNYY